jgi:hypothetical protein
MSTVNQKSNYDAEVIEDLDQRIDSLADVLEPISKMDRSELSPDQDADIKALVRCASITMPTCDLLLICILSELSVLATEWHNGEAHSPGDSGDEVRALAEAIERALGEYQVCVE